jgi:hypothetical protein
LINFVVGYHLKDIQTIVLFQPLDQKYLFKFQPKDVNDHNNVEEA